MFTTSKPEHSFHTVRTKTPHSPNPTLCEKLNLGVATPTVQCIASAGLQPGGLKGMSTPPAVLALKLLMASLSQSTPYPTCSTQQHTTHTSTVTVFNNVVTTRH